MAGRRLSGHPRRHPRPATAKRRRFSILVYGGFGLVLAAIIAAVAPVVTGSILDGAQPPKPPGNPSTGSRSSPIRPATTSGTPSPARSSPASAETKPPSGPAAAEPLRFHRAHARSPKAPEPGAAYTGGTSG